MKRFYKRAEVGTDPESGASTVLLDTRPVRTPGKALLALPTPALATAVAAEWAEQGEEIRPPAMPLMSLSCTAIDLVRPRRPEVVAEVAGFGETDLICYWSEEPPELAERQRLLWQPLIDWAALTHDAPLRATTSILPQPQPDDALRALTRAVEAHDDFALSGLATAVKAAGSLVVGLAMAEGHLTPDAAFEAAELDSTFQIEAWGEDAEGTKRRDGVRAELANVRQFLDCLRS